LDNIEYIGSVLKTLEIENAQDIIYGVKHFVSVLHFLRPDEISNEGYVDLITNLVFNLQFLCRPYSSIINRHDFDKNIDSQEEIIIMTVNPHNTYLEEEDKKKVAAYEPPKEQNDLTLRLSFDGMPRIFINDFPEELDNLSFAVLILLAAAKYKGKNEGWLLKDSEIKIKDRHEIEIESIRKNVGRSVKIILKTISKFSPSCNIVESARGTKKIRLGCFDKDAIIIDKSIKQFYDKKTAEKIKDYANRLLNNDDVQVAEIIEKDYENERDKFLNIKDNMTKACDILGWTYPKDTIKEEIREIESLITKVNEKISNMGEEE